ncbi:hypothetical protein [Gluconobacter thailandicus]|uniref:Uncharacterized protein n=1 Tax=Gluconobacter thailandicus TaxID=257438 RepID=A0AAP9EV64_GLUTH|nr:hypothetical protein [Gluconobacter thailandicus]QEH97312.1 hypothetical protein FXF46_14420 [Gluconobacter thailandicus]
MFAFTAIQTVRWRGFGFDRATGLIELRLGLVGLAFVSGDLWTKHKALRVQCDELMRENEALRGEVQRD